MRLQEAQQRLVGLAEQFLDSSVAQGQVLVDRC